ncbi:HET-domain-containing protein [Sarocladium strictum]
MYLINTRTFELEEFASSSSVRYAILSHTWHNGEVLFHDMAKSNLAQAQEKPGFRKILYTCQQAASSGLEYAWVDTCCINKTSSAELSEAINSMFQWYKDAQVCYVYLNDLSRSQLAQMEESTESIEATFGKCRWFSRGWTLQELIAPSSVEFYDCEWEHIGSKQSLVGILSHVTRIDHAVLDGSIKSSDVTAGRRMSWASRRETTRVEDLTYSLMGIFEINMPIMYGEGNKAFIRLQEEILRVSGDWTNVFDQSFILSRDRLFAGVASQFG